MNATIQLQIQVPHGSADETATFIRELLSNLEDGGEDQGDGLIVEFAASERTVEAALAHYSRAWPQRYDKLERLHHSLVELGYEAKLPDTRSESRNQYPYLRYIYPGNDRTLGSANSGAFAFAGRGFQERLQGEPGAQITRDGVRFQLDTQDAVDRIIEIARDAE